MTTIASKNPAFSILAAFTLFFSLVSYAQTSQSDLPFTQAYSVKYGLSPTLEDGKTKLKQVGSDRDGVIQVFSSQGLLRPRGGMHLYPGLLSKNKSYLPTADKNVQAMTTFNNQFIYADAKVVFSDAWAGKLYFHHQLTSVARLACGNGFGIMVTDGIRIHYFKDSVLVFRTSMDDRVLDIRYDATKVGFWILSTTSVHFFSEKDKKLQKIFSGEEFTCADVSESRSEMYLGTHDGYLTIDLKGGKAKGAIKRKLPSTDITTIRVIGGKLWFGSIDGAFCLQENGKFDYYASRRWICSNTVQDIQEGPGHTVLILTDKGLAEIRHQQTTLQDKAMFFEEQVRLRHMRSGLNCSLVGMKEGDLSTGIFENSDNDGLWTSMYLGAEALRYAVTHSPDALENCRESLDAMERLYSINKIPGFPSRSFQRAGYNKNDEPWRKADEEDWDWKSTTSSDEAIGHIFAFGVIAELVDDPGLKKKAISLIDTLMNHIVTHDLYLIDWNGKPTLWGRWNPEYVNARPKMVGDRKICSSNITAMLQTAYRFTGKKIYRDKALELLNQYGFLDNLMAPMSTIGKAPESADELSQNLSNTWNHSDDEMYFLGYWGLYRYAINDTLKKKFKESIIDHWQIERPEKEAAWNIFTAMTGVKEFDLRESVEFLQKYPIDLMNWTVVNSKRKDIEMMPYNFRDQTIKEVLAPTETPINRHNSNMFQLDGGDDGSSEYSAGDIWLLPYWMARYLGVIKAPEKGSMPTSTLTEKMNR